MISTDHIWCLFYSILYAIDSIEYQLLFSTDVYLHISDITIVVISNKKSQL
jgi:hypothetical protein